MKKLDASMKKLDASAEAIIEEGTGCCETMWNIFFGLLRSIPCLALLSFGLVLAAYVMVHFSSETVIEGSKDLGYDASEYVSYVWKLFLLMVFVNAIALLIGICTTGKFAELFFVESIEDEVNEVKQLCCFRCSEYSLEFVVMPLFELLLWVVFILALVLSYAFLIVYAIFMLLSYVCLNEGKAGVATTIDSALRTLLEHFFPDFDVDTGLPQFCSKAQSAGKLFAISPHTLQGAGLWLYLGCLFAVVAQVLQLVAMQGEWQRIYAAMFHERVKKGLVSQATTYKNEEVSQGRTYGSIDPALCSHDIDLA